MDMRIRILLLLAVLALLCVVVGQAVPLCNCSCASSCIQTCNSGGNLTNCCNLGKCLTSFSCGGAGCGGEVASLMKTLTGAPTFTPASPQPAAACSAAPALLFQ
jgi:hypothetical protein